MLPERRNRAYLLFAGTLIAGACSDQTPPTAPPVGANTVVAAAPGGGGGGNNAKVKIKMLQLSSNTVRIDGPAVTAEVSIGNSGLAIQTGVSIRAEIAQGAVTREAANLPTQCLPGDDPGFLPTGSCSMTFPAGASNSAPGTGTLTPGAAVLVVHLVRTTGADETELASKTVDINIVGTPEITDLTLSPTTLVIDGPGANYTATLNNPASTLQGVVLQGYMVQGSTRRAAGGIAVICDGSPGVLTPGTCVVSFSATASNSTGGMGTLVPGAASFELNLLQSAGGTETMYDIETVAVTLIPSTPEIVSVTLVSTQIEIDGPSVDYTAELRNPGVAVSDVILQGELVQTTNDGTVRKGAGGTYVDCGAGLGVLPTTGLGTCTIQFTVTASNSAGGTGTLVPGLAHFDLVLLSAPAGAPPIELDQEIVEVSLISNPPTITAVTPSSSFVVLGASFTSYTATIENPGATRTGVVIQGWISQGIARRAAGGRVVVCNGGPDGELPTGTCTVPSDIVGSNGTDGDGTLVPGAATFELELKQTVGTTETILDTKTVAITLVASAPSIVSVVFSPTNDVPLEGFTNYTATLYNPTAASLTSTSIQGWISQGVARYAAGGTVLTCPGAGGQLPVGSCVIVWPAVASNSNSGTGTLVAGPASFELELIQSGIVLDTKVVPINLTTASP